MKKQTLIFLLSLALVVSFAVSDDNLITKTCESTPDIKICESSLRSDPRSSTADSIGLIHIIIDVVKSKFTDSLVYVTKLMHESPPPIKAATLRNCYGALRTVIDSDVKVADSAVTLGNPKFGTNAMRDAAVEALSCQDGVTGSASNGDVVAELIKRTKFLDGLSNVAASMISTLE